MENSKQTSNAETEMAMNESAEAELKIQTSENMNEDAKAPVTQSNEVPSSPAVENKSPITLLKK